MLLAWRNWLRERLDASRLAPTRTSRDRRLAPPRSPLGREYARWLSDFFRSVCEWLRQILLGASHLHRAASHAGRETGLTSTGRLGRWFLHSLTPAPPLTCVWLHRCGARTSGS